MLQLVSGCGTVGAYRWLPGWGPVVRVVPFALAVLRRWVSRGFPRVVRGGAGTVRAGWNSGDCGGLRGSGCATVVLGLCGDCVLVEWIVFAARNGAATHRGDNFGPS
ncbi:hypothetical protein GCM10012286_30600 [Streptomyces lasiicapitis]|uniref:Uncharacterized protein n=1 Tax=Streptomyces lasiicapitis TaxID=1923961 RepID=A0ABQ2LXV0_9ACTN|nr:hypothetical protein GCM10012286_30600 [Streptomyces lasiicapitis]